MLLLVVIYFDICYYVHIREYCYLCWYETIIKHTDSKMVNTWNTLLLKDGSGKICKRRKKSKTVEQAKKDKKEKCRQQFIKDINNLKKPLAKKFHS